MPHVRQVQAQPEARPEMSKAQKALLGIALQIMCFDTNQNCVMTILRTAEGYRNTMDEDVRLDLDVLTSAELWQLEDLVKATSGGGYNPDGLNEGSQPMPRSPVKKAKKKKKGKKKGKGK
jgi:hypothetical protein